MGFVFYFMIFKIVILESAQITQSFFAICKIRGEANARRHTAI